MDLNMPGIVNGIKIFQIFQIFSLFLSPDKSRSLPKEANTTEHKNSMYVGIHTYMQKCSHNDFFFLHCLSNKHTFLDIKTVSGCITTAAHKCEISSSLE